jgi:hypothetical protein
MRKFAMPMQTPANPVSRRLFAALREKRKKRKNRKSRPATLKVIEPMPGAGVSSQRILSSIESCPPASKPRGIVGCAVRGCTLHPSLAKPVAVKLAVKITPEKDDQAHRQSSSISGCRILRDLIPGGRSSRRPHEGHAVHRAEGLASAGFERVRTRFGGAFDVAHRVSGYRKWALSRQRTLNPHA